MERLKQGRMTWACRLRRSASRRAFTLVELIVVIAIIGILATLVIVRYAGKTDQAKVAVAKSQLSQLKNAIIEFEAHCGRYPDSPEELIQRPSDCPNWQEGGYLEGTKVPKDPWQSEYRFRFEDGRFEVISLGSDGKEGGTGTARDLSSLNGNDPE